MSQGEETTPGAIGFGKNRIEALSDGVYAIAMTLLVLSLEEPGNGVHPFTVTFSDFASLLFPDLFTYVIAFLILSGFWVGNHIFFHSLQRIDQTLLWTTIFQLFFITLVPFSTIFSGDYPEQVVASTVFSLNLFAISLLYFFSWRHAQKKYEVLDHRPDRGTMKMGITMSKATVVVSIIVVALAIAGVPWCLTIFAMVPFIYLVLKKGWGERFIR